MWQLARQPLAPGATLVAGWAWREEVLASKRHWAAVTKAG